MSRCFPFPPPGYVVNGIRDEAMIESIKGGEEKCDKELRRKERKRDKKDKKGDKEKKDKEKKDKKDKKRKEREGESEKHSHKRRRKEEVVAKDVQNIQKVDVFGKLKESEINCLEKSSLTVEPELVQSTSQNSCDSTLNSNEKDKKQPFNARHNSNELPKEEMEMQMQPLDGSRHNNNDSESIIRIRLPIRRPKDPEVMMMMTNKDQPCPSRDIKLDSLVTKEQPQQRPCSTSAPEQEKRKKHTSSRKHKEKKVPSSTQETYQPSSLCRLCPPSLAEHFLNVVENWVPNTIESRVELTNSEDEDESWWLVKKKPSSHKIDTSKQLNRNNEIKEVVISSSIAWPRASLLPEADVYALPYTVPF
ncbi:hypothetical protein HID58_013284 [Brassica napus]|uniref:BnaAnng08330D protein n=2 Tax=Brassica napus TaxID=3708 RepID=A0A078I832_BRANA|nr:DNA ligase 1 [Brassica napus]KAH0936167.1 hypothetical protein HID58_013284 [Brassica napus]CAF2133266.1 unnamed protein product [Brassica napus]CDY47045.1 BnaAnng08330D [Brassica napus]